MLALVKKYMNAAALIECEIEKRPRYFDQNNIGASI